MSKLEFNPENQSLRQVLGNGIKYEVPKFQRDYSWEAEQLEILWEDIEDLINGINNYHYMGYLVLQEMAEDNKYKIIDGQQRLTSFSLFFLACIKKLKEEKKEKKQEEKEKKIAAIFFRSFIGVEELDGTYINKKLTLNKNNHYFYTQAVNEEEIPQRGQKKTVHLMRKAIDFFYTKIKNTNGEEISQWAKKIVDRFLFTIIYIGNELSAYKVFETLNARGVHLSSSDLIKNYLFSKIDDTNTIPEETIKELENSWEVIGENIGDKYYTEYIFNEWNSQNKYTRKAKLYAAIQNQIKKNSEAKNYLDRISINSQIYEGITNPDSDFFKDHPDYNNSQKKISIQKELSVLKLFNISQPYSLLIIAYQKHKNDFGKILKWIAHFSIRYNVICGKHHGYQEQLYNQICLQINKDCSLEDIKKKLLEKYPDDENFKKSFSDKTMLTHQSNKKVKYLLARLEENLSNNSIDESILTVEHLLPLKPEDEWISNFGENYALFNQRIGNMALVNHNINRELLQKNFQEKKRILLEKSNYHIHQNLKNYEVWTSEEVESRQKALAETAAKVWRVE